MASRTQVGPFFVSVPGLPPAALITDGPRAWLLSRSGSGRMIPHRNGEVFTCHVISSSERIGARDDGEAQQPALLVDQAGVRSRTMSQTAQGWRTRYQEASARARRREESRKTSAVGACRCHTGGNRQSVCDCRTLARRWGEGVSNGSAMAQRGTAPWLCARPRSYARGASPAPLPGPPLKVCRMALPGLR